MLVDDVRPLPSHVGDLPCVPATGVYCCMMASNHNWCRRIPIVSVADDVARLAARHEPCAEPLARNVD